MQAPWFEGIPHGWASVPLYAVAAERRVPNKGLREANLLSLSYGNIIRKDINTSDGLLPASFETYQLVEPNNIVLRMTDLQNDQRSLRSALVTERGIITSAYLALSLRNVNPRFMAYQFRAIDLMKVFYSMGGGLRQSIGYGDLKRLPVLLPPPKEQRAIADYLDRETAQIDAFIAKNEELIALLTERRAAAVSEYVSRGIDASAPMKPSGVPWLGSVPEHWNVIRARYLCTVGTGDGDTVDAVDEGAYPFYVRSETPQRSDRFGFDTEAVLTSGDGAGVGKVFHLVNEKFAAHQRVYVLHSFRHVSASFFYRYFAMYFGMVALDGSAKSTVDSVRRHMITDMPIAVPPMEEQAAIVAAVESTAARIDATIQTARRSVELARERRAALISAAVTGKIDVGVAA